MPVPEEENDSIPLAASEGELSGLSKAPVMPMGIGDLAQGCRCGASREIPFAVKGIEPSDCFNQTSLALSGLH
jgi:hypothetical protein